MDHNTRLDRFKTAVFSEIEAETIKSKLTSKQEFDDKLKENTDKHLQASYDYIQSKTNEIKKDTKRELAKLGLENKRKLLNKRNELVDSIFAAIEKKITDFIKTQEYQDFLLDEIESFSNKYQIDDVEIFVGALDFKNEVYIQKAYKLNSTVILDKNITFGGFAIKDTKSNIYHDYTLHSKLEQQKTDFTLKNDFALS